MFKDSRQAMTSALGSVACSPESSNAIFISAYHINISKDMLLTTAKKQTGIIFSKPLDCHVWVEVSENSIESIEFRRFGEVKKLPITDDLTRYFSGKPVDFLKYDVCLEGFKPFEQAVLKETRKISYGTRITYSELAERVEHSRAAHAVGNALGKNPVPIVIPCHRVVGKDNIGGYSRDLEIKKRLLSLENPSVRDS